MEGVNQFELAPSNIEILDSGISVPSRSVVTVIIDHFLDLVSISFSKRRICSATE